MNRASEGLLARVRQIRRGLAPADAGPPPGPEPSSRADPERTADLRARVAHLEQMIQGFQDAVYRESRRQEKRIADLEARTEPAALAAALSRDARERGI
jgi:hypothetical protein